MLTEGGCTLQRGIISVKTIDGVTVLNHCTSSDDA